MLKIFFITIFIAELIISVAIIVKIIEFNKYIKLLNKRVSYNRDVIQTLLIDIRLLMGLVTEYSTKLISIITRKRKEYLLGFIKNTIMYASFFLLKGKYQKAVLAFQVIKNICDGFEEKQA